MQGRTGREQFHRLADADSSYPPRILEALGKGAPDLLYYSGNLDLLHKPALAIIGTRRPSRDGVRAAQNYARAAAESGWVIISGNAPGIDAAAHAAALEAGGETIVCPPSPPDQYVPVFGTKGDAQAADNGAILVLSPFAPGVTMEKYFFLKRNELVAAHARVVLVAETGTRGGTLNTVAHVRRLGRPLLITRLPDGAPHFDAHRLLIAGGAVEVPLKCDHNVFGRIVDEARRSDSASMPPAEDLFLPLENGGVSQ